jgi:electron transport complex protein RnfG
MNTRMPASQLPAALGLVVLCLVGAAVVEFTARANRTVISGHREQALLATLRPLLPGVPFDNQPQRDVIWRAPGPGPVQPVYRARLEGQPTGAVLGILAPAGYVAPLRLLVGVTPDGSVLGVRVVEHRETPGIGARVAERPLDAFAGATVTTRAVHSAIEAASAYVRAHRDDLFAADESANE